MRMRELEKASGVGRETIRFYIREGLLPEPERASRNSAFYSDEHVARLKTIKRLQEERFLPLAVIRGLLEAEDSVGAAGLGAGAAFPMLDSLLAARIGADGAPKKLSDVMMAQGFSADYADGHVLSGMIAVDEQGRVASADQAILETLKALWDIGFNRDRGFMPEDMQLFVELIDWLVAQEMKMFFGQLAGHVGESEAVEMATRGLPLINDLLVKLHNRAVVRALRARRVVANDNADDDADDDTDDDTGADLEGVDG